MSPLDDSQQLAAQLLARRWLPRSHPLVKRALIDTELWNQLGARLAGVGLQLVGNGSIEEANSRRIA